MSPCVPRRLTLLSPREIKALLAQYGGTGGGVGSISDDLTALWRVCSAWYFLEVIGRPVIQELERECGLLLPPIHCVFLHLVEASDFTPKDFRRA